MVQVQSWTMTDYFSGDNNLLGVGNTKTEAEFTAGRGLSATPATAIGATATEPLNEVFRFQQQTARMFLMSL